MKCFQRTFFKWVDEIKNNDVFTFDYTRYRSHKSASIEMFKKLYYGRYEDMEDIDATEYEWIEACNNSGLTYCKAGKYQSYGTNNCYIYGKNKKDNITKGSVIFCK